MNSKLVFVRRTLKEIEVFGGKVYIDIDGKNIGELSTSDFTIELTPGIHKVKMYKSHTYDTYIGFAESEINLSENENLLIKYSAPMLVNQPGNIMISNYESMEAINKIVEEKEHLISKSVNDDIQKKQETEDKRRSANTILIVIVIIIIIALIIEFAYIFSI